MQSQDTIPMGIREKLRDNRSLGLAAGIGLLVIATLIVVKTFWPQKQADLDQTFYSDDDGKTWFADSTFRVAPFERNGKTAVVAHVFNYADGSKEFCGYLAQFTPEAKAKLEAGLAETAKAGKPLNSLWMWSDRTFMSTGTLVKKPGAAEWVPYNDARASEVFAIKSPDGSTIDQSFVK